MHDGGRDAARRHRPPVFLEGAATLERAAIAVREAARGGASLIVFPETFVPGYPAWIWRLRPGTDLALRRKLHARLRAHSVSMADADLEDRGTVESTEQFIERAVGAGFRD